MLHKSMQTTWMASRQAGVAPASQYAASSAVRPCTCPSSPCWPPRSKKQVCHRSASRRYSPVCLSMANRARPRRCSSIPRCATAAAGRSSSGSAAAANACVHHRPGNPGVPGRLRRGDPPLSDLSAGLPAQPGRDPAPRRQLRHPLGERLTGALPVLALAADLDPPHVHRIPGPPHVPRPGHHRLMHPVRDRAAIRARPSRLQAVIDDTSIPPSGAASTPATCRPSTPNSADAVSSNTMPAASW